MDVSTILKKVRRIQIVANRSVDDIFAGHYKSVFRGRGMEFDEVRQYQPGDDIRSIDWNVTARTGMPYIKRYCEERELTVLFLVDISASGLFGSGGRSKLDAIVEAAAMLMFTALKNNDKVGLVTFCDDVVDYFPPRKGKANVLRLIRHLVAVEPIARETNLTSVLEYVGRVQKKKAVTFLLSDFQAPLTQKATAICNRRHDLVAMTVEDPREHALPDVGFITLCDAETGEVVELDTHSPRVRELFARQANQKREKVSQTLKRVGVDQIEVAPDEDFSTTFQKFFAKREKRFR